jgi:hypothetical protein
MPASASLLAGPPEDPPVMHAIPAWNNADCLIPIMPRALAELAMGHEALAEAYAVTLQQGRVRSLIILWTGRGWIGGIFAAGVSLTSPLTERNWSYRRGNNGAGVIRPRKPLKNRHWQPACEDDIRRLEMLPPAPALCRQACPFAVGFCSFGIALFWLPLPPTSFLAAGRCPEGKVNASKRAMLGCRLVTITNLRTRNALLISLS